MNQWKPRPGPLIRVQVVCFCLVIPRGLRSMGVVRLYWRKRRQKS
uniref:Macaca fascicularis brain cDNA clone: QbsB-10193, similar to human thyroid autoantigen 70kDa (Ku antigen) (G22P1), mRNA, RefSeq: NM_001469.2 n=1 Tax=Macaca fascicularis TaxID=9541 RepID=I7GH03_MACFA|nr:unnamed protein product [Macaca fascicularis]